MFFQLDAAVCSIVKVVFFSCSSRLWNAFLISRISATYNLLRFKCHVNLLFSLNLFLYYHFFSLFLTEVFAFSSTPCNSLRLCPTYTYLFGMFIQKWFTSFLYLASLLYLFSLFTFLTPDSSNIVLLANLLFLSITLFNFSQVSFSYIFKASFVFLFLTC